MLLNNKQKKKSGSGGAGAGGGKRLLISVTVLGSAGPLRFVVGEYESVSVIIETALKSYAREGRLPLLTSDLDDFFLYSPTAGHEALSPIGAIGSFGSRNFMLCKKPTTATTSPSEDRKDTTTTTTTSVRKSGGANWKSWLNKSINMKISTH